MAESQRLDPEPVAAPAPLELVGHGPVANLPDRVVDHDVGGLLDLGPIIMGRLRAVAHVLYPWN